MSHDIERILETCIYPTRNGTQGLEVLMIQRQEGHNKGLWVPPGGKIMFDESPRERALREIQKTGLHPSTALFRGLVTEISPFEHKQWLLFLYVSTSHQGEALANLDEGKLQWVPLVDLPMLPKPQSDAVFGPAVLDLSGDFFEATMLFDASLKLVETRVVGS
jgi:8-oxo-dGTP diphosphatase